MDHERSALAAEHVPFLKCTGNRGRVGERVNEMTKSVDYRAALENVGKWEVFFIDRESAPSSIVDPDATARSHFTAHAAAIAIRAPAGVR